MDATQLKRISIFEDVPDEDLRVITTFATTDEVGEGTEIVKEGDFANHFMAIEDGRRDRGRHLARAADQDRALGAGADEEGAAARLREDPAGRRRAPPQPGRGLTKPSRFAQHGSRWSMGADGATLAVVGA